MVRVSDVRGCCRAYGIFHFWFSSGTVWYEFEVYADVCVYFVSALRCQGGQGGEKLHLYRLEILEQAKWNEGIRDI